MSNSNTALITGASSGIGLELAKLHASRGGNLVLVARSGNKLNRLKQEIEQQYKVAVTVVVADLAEAQSANEIYEQTQQAGIHVSTLINNAGFGGHGLFSERALADEQAMMQVNMTSLISLTHLYLPNMIAKNDGRILNVSSTASFMPGPLQAVYYATKAFVTSFSQAIAEELKEHNITVTTLCPGAVATGFVAAADLENVDIFKQAKSPQSVAKCGYEAMEKGRLVAFNEGTLRFMLEWVVPLLPRKLVLKLSRQAMEKSE